MSFRSMQTATMALLASWDSRRCQQLRNSRLLAPRFAIHGTGGRQGEVNRTAHPRRAATSNLQAPMRKPMCHSIPLRMLLQK